MHKQNVIISHFVALTMLNICILQVCAIEYELYQASLQTLYNTLINKYIPRVRNSQSCTAYLQFQTIIQSQISE